MKKVFCPLLCATMLLTASAQQRKVSPNDTLRSIVTNSDGYDIAKSPEDMFELEIDNDLKAVDDRIREFYGMNEKKKEAKAK